MQCRTVLVTGGTGTIGSSIVRALCEQPAGVDRNAASGSFHRWRVIANYAHDEERAMQLHHATGCDVQRADIGDEAQVEALFTEFERTIASTSGEPLFALVHVAGVSHNALLPRQTPEEWRETMRVNADGAFLITRAALRYLSDGGRLILLASRVGERGNAGQGAYSASKAAVIALMRCAAREGAARGITVNAICPGFVPSALTMSLPAERLTEFKNQSVLSAFGAPAEVAGTVQWLLSDEASAISGQVIHCDSRI
jgi:NAD(P)-dependent dehydrogenase (short-subunit alcohol dehydrogenase family)